MLPAAVAGVSAAKKVTSAATTYLASYNHATDRQRQATNTLAYNAATAPGGSVAAFMFLKGRSGKFGLIANVPPIPGVTGGGAIGGWASPPARDDANAKYTALAPKYESGTLPVGTGQRTGNDPVTGQAPATAGLGGSSVWMWVIAAGIGIALLIGVKRRES